MKIGRNAPCPCGSGKKYKKCCLYLPKPVKGNSKVREDDTNLEKTIDLKPKKLHPKQMETEQIFQMLHDSGIHINKQQLVSELRLVDSVNELLHKWNIIAHLNNEGERRITAAIVALAERLAPDHLLLETLQHLMQEGYGSDGNAKDDLYKVTLWWKLWREFQQWLGGKKITSVEEVDKITNSVLAKTFSEWLLDFEQALLYNGFTDSYYHHMRKILAEDVLEKFSNSNKTIIETMVVALGESHFFLGDTEKADEIFQTYLADNEHAPWVYIHWGDLYNPEMGQDMADIEKASILYRKAMKAAEVREDKEAAQTRLHSLLINV
ncbi:SEC-C metal-binding domain-containing protein [Oceanobacillus piezotolerans]|uniref:SEC-C metal-binding domain-containing protein n=1 Tax=Oceanobacillus piezotolerans TaxID=2448030 RepID=UPI001CA3F0D4|nr:SEC-C metal-binding domain-containing protein [Oceanobacillus piezotolerans]